MVRNAGAIRAGRAYVELYGDDSKLVKALRSAEGKLRAFGRQISDLGARMAKVGAAIFAPLAGTARLFSSMGDQVAKMAKRTGVTAETLSELRFVASQTGTEFETLENAFRKMQRSIYDAGRGLSTQVDAFADLGLTFQDLDGLSPEEQFKLLADRIAAVEDPTKKAAIAMSLFGRTGTNLLPMFAQGRAGIEALQAEARRLGLTMSGADAKAAEDFTDAMDRLWKVVKMGAFHVGAALAPAIQDAGERLMRAARQAGGWVQRNRDLLVTALKLAAGLAAFGAATFVIGKVVGALSMVPKALRLAGAAMKWLAVHPMIGAFAGWTAVLVGTSQAIRTLIERKAQLSDAMSDVLGKGDRLRAEDQRRMQRLQELAKRETLNNSQMQEASEIIDALQGRYGDLGLALDRTAGKLRGVTEAQDAFNKALRQAAVIEVEQAISEVLANLDEINAELRSAGTAFENPSFASLGYSEKDQARTQAKWKAEMAKYRALAIRLRALKGGSVSALTGEPGAVGVAPALDLDEAADADGRASQLASLREQAAKRVHRLLIEQIEDRHRREHALLNMRYDEELARAAELKADQETTQRIWKALYLEREALEKRFAEQRRQELQRQADEQARLAEQQAAIRERIAAGNLDRGYRIRQLRIEATKEGLDREMALLALQRRRDLEAARAAGERLDLVNREYDLREQMAKAADAASRAVQRQEILAEARGTFSADAVKYLQHGSVSLQERIARGIENLLRVGRGIEQNTETGAVFE